MKLGIGLPNTMAFETDRRLMLDWARLADEAGFRVLEDGAEHDRALFLLAAKYEQYRSEPPPGPVIAVGLTEWRGWSASPEAFDDDPGGLP